MQRQDGFTLIELMLTISIIAILAAIVVPQMGELHRKALEGATKGNLGQLRSAISIYYGDTEGAQLVDLEALVPKYINAIPSAHFPTHHSDANTTGAGNYAAWLASFTETSAWWLMLDGIGGSTYQVIANCIHNDAAGRKWSDQ